MKQYQMIATFLDISWSVSHIPSRTWKISHHIYSSLSWVVLGVSVFSMYTPARGILFLWLVKYFDNGLPHNHIFCTLYNHIHAGNYIHQYIMHVYANHSYYLTMPQNVSLHTLNGLNRPNSVGRVYIEQYNIVKAIIGWWKNVSVTGKF